jgi:hypothetical protein
MKKPINFAIEKGSFDYNWICHDDPEDNEEYEYNLIAMGDGFKTQEQAASALTEFLAEIHSFNYVLPGKTKKAKRQ